MSSDDESRRQTMERSIKLLRAKRGHLKARVTRIKTFLETFNVDTQSLSNLTARLQKLEECWADFNIVQTEIQAADITDDDADDETEYVLFEENYFDIRARIEDLLSAQRAPVTDNSVRLPPDHSDVSGVVKLPHIPLPSFSGNYEDWTDFYDIFDSMIHNSTNLTKIQKFFYLRSCLKDEALRTIKEIKVSACNYDSAWSTLKQRFANKRLIIKAHVQGILNIKRLDKPSAIGLKDLYDTISNHLTALRNLGESVDQWGTLLLFLLVSKLDPETRDRWEAYNTKRMLNEKNEDLIDVASESSSITSELLSSPYVFKDLMTFINGQFVIQEVREENRPSKTISKGAFNKNNSKGSQPIQAYVNKIQPQVDKTQCNTTNASPFKRLCIICKQDHATFSCNQLTTCNSSQRYAKVREHNLCLNCLKKGHKTIQCKSPYSCKQCKKRHHTILHIENAQGKADSQPLEKEDEFKNASHVVASCSSKNQEVILATAVVLIADSQGNYYPGRALLDSGSQSHFISQSLAYALGLQQVKASTSITGIGNSGTSAKHSARTTIKSRFGAYHEELEFLVLKKIVHDLPSSSIIKDFNIPDKINLADNEFFKSRGIDLLLGASIFYTILRKGKINLGPDLPVLQSTEFGWIVSGKIMSDNAREPQTSSAITTQCNTAVLNDLEDLISSFWRIEELRGEESKTYEEKACEQHYICNFKRQLDGRFVVNLPFSADPKIALGQSKDHAIKRLKSLEQRFIRQPDLKQAYIEFLNEYLENGEMELVTDIHEPDLTYYLPHHPVIKETSSSTRLRVVFDASSKTSTNNSLNDILMTGPTMQRDIVSILLSFRIPMYVFTADIKQMYRQILIAEDERDLQRILWRNDPADEINVYRLKTVTYGTASAPFLAIRTLVQLAKDGKQSFPMGAECILRDFYVDDVLTGSDSLDQILELQLQLITILKEGGFELHKWCSNLPSILENIPFDHIESGFTIEESRDKAIKTLGMFWQPSSDTFRFKINVTKPPNLITKRFILSDISKLFDPIGLVAPIVIAAKLIMQEIWQIKDLGWDVQVPESIFVKWTNYRNSLHILNQLSVDRRVVRGSSDQHYELHGFSDASEKAYGACCYIRTIQEGVITVKLLCAKSRVAPLKAISLPRLELCGALLLSKLIQKIRNALEINVASITLWTDSTIVLHWLNSPPQTWQTYVRNRTSQIQDSTQNCTWMHVRSNDNPADLISRSVCPDKLLFCELWWNGPRWLSKCQDYWPKPIQITSINLEIEERKQTITVQLVNSTSLDFLDKFSSWQKLLRISALCLRFINNCRNPKSKSTDYLTAEDLHKAELIWIKHAQVEFKEVILQLQKGSKVTNKVKSLVPFLDANGIIRVGGRLKHALVPSDFKNPILLPYNHHITKLIAVCKHFETMHAGPQALLAAIRTKYWPINGKVLTRSIIKNCIRCSRLAPKVIQHLMGDLPPYRVQPACPFEHCGIDFCGPILFRRVMQKRSAPTKAYVALFICMSTKAIHLELVPDLSTKKFIEALERMIARRGNIKHIYSDNGTNFVGANNLLHEFKQMLASEDHLHLTHSFCAAKGITWHFIPPRSPHFGGLWEAGIKTIKYHLKRVMGTNILFYDELETLLVKVEACVNSRPLTSLTNDPNDLSPLTPAHFLTGGNTLSSIPTPDLTEINVNRLDQWQRLQHIYQNFWRRWSTEYLSTLQQRNKWNIDYKPPQPGALVLLREDFRPPLHWELGRIQELHYGPDGRARIASVRTAKGLIKRALNKLCLLFDA